MSIAKDFTNHTRVNTSEYRSVSTDKKQSTPAWVETLRLSPAKTQAVYQALRPLLPNICSELALVAMADEIANALRRSLSTRILNAIESFSERSVVLQVIEGWPIDSLALPNTPSHHAAGISDICLYAMIQVGYCVLRGERPISYVHENEGRLIRHVTPKITQQSAASSHGSVILDPHTDSAHKPIASLEATASEAPAPGSLTLFSLRSELRVPTMFACVEEIVAQLPTKVVQELERSVYQFRPPQSFAISASTLIGPLLILSARKYVRYGHVTAPKGAPLAALRRLQDLLSRKALWLPILLLPGASVCFKQNEVLHARSAISPRFDGGDRWMLRLYGLSKQCEVKPVYEEVPYLLL